MVVLSYFIIFTFLMLASQTNTLVFPIPGFVYPLLFLFSLFLYTLIGDNKIKVNYFIVMVLILAHVYYKITIDSFVITSTMTVLTAFLFVKTFKLNLIKSFTNLMYLFAIISLLFFSFQVLFFNQLITAMNELSFEIGLTSNKFDGVYNANIIVFTINQTDAFQNCGFMWEPGPFASLLLLALFFEIFFNNCKVGNRAIVLVITILTTFTTTGYLGLLVVFAGYVQHSSSSSSLKKWYLFPLLIFVTISIYQLPFVSEKIVGLMDFSSVGLTNSLESNTFKEEQRSLGRFSGLMMNLSDLSRSPVFGSGKIVSDEISNRYGMQYSMNGIGNLIAKHGLVGLAFFTYFLILSYKFLNAKYKSRFTISFPAIILLTNFSFYLWPSYIYLVIILIFVAQSDSNHKKDTDYIG